MKSKFLAYVSAVLVIFVVFPFKTLAQENSKIEITKEQKIKDFSKLSKIEKCKKIEFFLKEIEKKHDAANKKEVPSELSEFKVAGNDAFEKVQEILAEEKDKLRKNILKASKLQEKENKQYAKNVLQKGVIEAMREEYKKINMEHLLTHEVIESFKTEAIQKYMKEMASTLLQGSESYINWVMKDVSTQSIIFMFDDKTADSIFEDLLEIEENFNKII